MRSVLDQDYPNIEYIVMDGGSTDGSVEIIKRYADRLGFWTSGPDGGQSAAITAGWKRARGDIIAEIDTSDLIAPGGVRKAVEALQRHEDWAMVFSDCSWIDEQGRVTLPWTGRRFDIADMLCGNYVMQPTVFMRRSCLQRVGYYDPSFHMSMDFDLWMRIGREFPVGYLEGEVLGLMREHADSKTVTSARLFLDENVRVIEKTLAFLGSRPDLASAGRRAVACATARHAGYAVRDHEYREARSALWRVLRSGSLEPWRRYGRDLLPIAVEAFLGPGVVGAIRSVKRRVTGRSA